MAAIISSISGFMYGKLLIIMLLAVGLYFTVRTGFVQLRLFGESVRVVAEKPKKEGAVSSFKALMVSTASRVGTGNIVGVSTAICLGGYGAVFWMWLIALIGGSSAFIESTLAQIYKKKGNDGSYGGPAYYIEAALHSRPLACLFAVCLILTYGAGFNMLASYNLQSTFSVFEFYRPETFPWIAGAVIAILVFWCLMGGGKRIMSATSALVPIMGLIYIAVAIIIVVINIGLLPGVFARIFTEAFDFQAILGGFAGSCVMQGIKRGLYSNEAGIGSAPNAAAAADVSHPVKQGLVQMLSVFIDTLLVCSATAFMCLCSGVEPTAELSGAPFVQAAMAASLGSFGPIFVTLSMSLFAFTTLIGNLYYVDNCLAYILGRVPGKTFMTIYRIIASLLIFIGAGLSMGFLWDFADVLMGLMAIINLPVICILGKYALAALKDYMGQRAAGQDPVFRAKSIGLPTETDYWND